MISRTIALVLLLGAHVFAQAPAAAPPNIIIIFTDDQGYEDVGVFGAKGIKTPNLDRLAAEGRTFTNFHVPQPVCSASRCGLLTGYSSNPRWIGRNCGSDPRCHFPAIPVA